MPEEEIKNNENLEPEETGESLPESDSDTQGDAAKSDLEIWEDDESMMPPRPEDLEDTSDSDGDNSGDESRQEEADDDGDARTDDDAASDSEDDDDSEDSDKDDAESDDDSDDEGIPDDSDGEDTGSDQYAGKFKTVKDLEKGYKNVLNMYNSLKDQVEKLSNERATPKPIKRPDKQAQEIAEELQEMDLGIDFMDAENQKKFIQTVIQRVQDGMRPRIEPLEQMYEQQKAGAAIEKARENAEQYPQFSDLEDDMAALTQEIPEFFQVFATSNGIDYDKAIEFAYNYTRGKKLNADEIRQQGAAAERKKADKEIAELKKKFNKKLEDLAVGNAAAGKKKPSKAQPGTGGKNKLSPMEQWENN